MGRHEESERRGFDPERAGAPRRTGWGAAIAVAIAAVVLSLVAVNAVGFPGSESSDAGSAAEASETSFVPMRPILDPVPTTTATIDSTSTTDATVTTDATAGTGDVVLDAYQVFAATSPFNAPISGDPILDPGSERIAAALSEKVVANLYEFGIAIYEVDESTDPVTVNCTKPWGTCLLEGSRHRVPDGAQPAPGDDGTLVVIDWSERRTVEMWQAVQRSSETWSTSWGTTTPIDGTGIPTLFGNGAGVSHLAGVVRVEEIANGRIDHALVFSTDNACRDVFRYPATKTDGDSTRVDCIPEGTRIQLDPEIDLDAVRLTPAERAIGRALQTYGAYAIDGGGTPMAFYFEVAFDATPGNPGFGYSSAGLDRDFFPLQAIPWDHLRILKSWDGS